MAKEEMIPILKAVGATEWINAGFKGQGIKVWNCEDLTDHGKASRQMVLDVASDVEIYIGSINMSTGGDEFNNPPTVNGKGLLQFD